MRPPLAGRRDLARRLAGGVLRRLEPVERLLPVRVPGFGGERESDEPATAVPSGPSPEEVAARLDAARDRLRAEIEPLEDD